MHTQKVYYVIELEPGKYLGATSSKRFITSEIAKSFGSGTRHRAANRLYHYRKETGERFPQARVIEATECRVAQKKARGHYIEGVEQVKDDNMLERINKCCHNSSDEKRMTEEIYKIAALIREKTPRKPQGESSHCSESFLHEIPHMAQDGHNRNSGNY